MCKMHICILICISISKADKTKYLKTIYWASVDSKFIWIAGIMEVCLCLISYFIIKKWLYSTVHPLGHLSYLWLSDNETLLLHKENKQNTHADRTGPMYKLPTWSKFRRHIDRTITVVSNPRPVKIPAVSRAISEFLMLRFKACYYHT